MLYLLNVALYYLLLSAVFLFLSRYYSDLVLYVCLWNPKFGSNIFLCQGVKQIGLQNIDYYLQLTCNAINYLLPSVVFQFLSGCYSEPVFHICL